jgi:DNA-binding transcriptional regulator WhiA
MKVRQQTVDKYYAFLKELAVIHESKGDIVNLSSIITEKKLNNYVSATMVKLGYIKRTSKSTYKLLLVKPQPKHARELLDYMNSVRNNVKPIKVIPKETSKKVINKVSKTEIKTSNKEFSLLWGLIKVKF